MSGNELLLILFCIGCLESGNDDGEVGRYGEIGRYQLTRDYIESVNQHYGTEYRFSHAFDPDQARHIALRFLWMHSALKLQETGTLTVQDIANIHHGGENGWKAGSTRYSQHIEWLYEQHKESK